PVWAGPRISASVPRAWERESMPRSSHKRYSQNARPLELAPPIAATFRHKQAPEQPLPALELSPILPLPEARSRPRFQSWLRPPPRTLRQHPPERDLQRQVGGELAGQR